MPLMPRPAVVEHRNDAQSGCTSPLRRKALFPAYDLPCRLSALKCNRGNESSADQGIFKTCVDEMSHAAAAARQVPSVSLTPLEVPVASNGEQRTPVGEGDLKDKNNESNGFGGLLRDHAADPAIGGLVGLLVSDALGVPWEFHPPEKPICLSWAGGGVGVHVKVKPTA